MKVTFKIIFCVLMILAFIKVSSKSVLKQMCQKDFGKNLHHLMKNIGKKVFKR